MTPSPLDLLAAEPDRTRRGLLLVALLGEAVGVDPIVVGGFAVETWTRGGYTTADVDLVCPRRAEALGWLRDMGFREAGRHVVHDGLGLAVEIPSDVLDQGQEAYDHLVRWQVGGRAVAVLSVEDTIVDRLCDLVWGGATGERENVYRLLAAWSHDLDLDWLGRRAAKEQVTDELASCRAWVRAQLGETP